MTLKQLLDFKRMRSFVDLVYLNTFLLIMALNGLLNSFSYAKTMALNINTPRCNGMVERLIKILKHGFTILSINLEHAQN
jgi:hypothetical protein